MHCRYYLMIAMMGLGILEFAGGTCEASDPLQQRAAMDVFNRVTSGRMHDVRMESIPAEGGRDVYEYEANGGTLTLRGASTVALCRAFYDYARANNMGQVSWAGAVLRIPEKWPDAIKTRLVTPFEIRHAYNAVTSGYTTPYWTWEQWEKELDWQAIHGFNMMMAPIATEAIMERVWLEMGFTQMEIDANACGPAHMPWLRMGCICGVDGYLPKQWHADQISLQHKVLGRMRELGIEPVVQGFNGFVPHAFTRLHPEIKLIYTCWNGALPARNRPTMLPLDNPIFPSITKAYMDGWKKEFGEAKYFLVDSFNELEVPKTIRPVSELLADYGEKTWEAIHAANPDAIWVIQGWTFGYQHWPEANLAALLSKVPDDRMLVLDYANDYFPVWKKYKAFYGKNWACGYVPNMGGKTGYTGNLGLYASLSANTLKDPQRGHLKGFTLEGEGLENNDAVYELLTDMAWSAEPVNLDEWFVKYSNNRYGGCPAAIAESWKLLRQGCYSKLFAHPRFSWQRGGAIDRNPNFYTAAERFLSVSDEFKDSPLYRADAIERGALALGLKADEWYGLAKQAFNAGEMELFEEASRRVLELLMQTDRLMEAHPYHRLERWIEFARAHGETPELKQMYESNAKCIVTYWASGVQNYSARVWGGLVRDYYREWIRREFESMKSGKGFDANRFMIDYTRTTGTSPFTPCIDPIADAKAWLKQAMSEKLPKLTAPGQGEVVGEWTPGQTPTNWKTVEWTIPAEKLAKLTGVVFNYAGGKHRLEIQSLQIVADGKVVAEDMHFGFAGKPSQLNTYKFAIAAGTTANNGCVIRSVVKGGGGTDSKGTVELILLK